MPLDVLASYAAPDAPLTGSDAARRLRLSMQAAPICLMPRMIPSKIVELLDRADPQDLPRIDVSGSLAEVQRVIAAQTAARDAKTPATLLKWLREDVVALVCLYAEASAAAKVRVCLQITQDNISRASRVDDLASCLVTTYRGLGTEWLPQQHLDALPANRPIAPDEFRHIERGTIVIIRGGKDATPDRPGVLHRFPPTGEGSLARLFLAVNEVEGRPQQK